MDSLRWDSGISNFTAPQVILCAAEVETSGICSCEHFYIGKNFSSDQFLSKYLWNNELYQMLSLPPSIPLLPLPPLVLLPFSFPSLSLTPTLLPAILVKPQPSLSPWIKSLYSLASVSLSVKHKTYIRWGGWGRRVDWFLNFCFVLNHFSTLIICLGSKSLVLKNSFSFCAHPHESENFLCLQLILGQRPSLSNSSPVNLPPFSISRTPRIKSPLCVPLAKHCQTPKRTEQSVMAFLKCDYGRKRRMSHCGDEKYLHWVSYLCEW